MSARRLELGCTLDLANTPDSLHAHVELDGNPALGPGDRVQVHEAPTALAHGQQMVVRRRATVTRASRMAGLRVKLAALFGVVSLLEIGFSVGRDR